MAGTDPAAQTRFDEIRHAASERGWQVERAGGGRHDGGCDVLVDVQAESPMIKLARSPAGGAGAMVTLAELPVDLSAAALAAAIEAVGAGLSVGIPTTGIRSGEPGDLLTPAESRVLDALLEGRSNREIAEHLSVSVNTVKFHLSSIYATFDVTSRNQLFAIFGTSTSLG